jgi:hypothetical protein
MTLITIPSRDRQAALSQYGTFTKMLKNCKKKYAILIKASIITGEIWTAARDTKDCPGEYRWCSTKLTDTLKRNLFWREIYKGKSNSCVYITIDDANKRTKYDSSLGLSDCEDPKRFVCEVIFKNTRLPCGYVIFYPFHLFMRNAPRISLKILLIKGL